MDCPPRIIPRPDAFVLSPGELFPGFAQPMDGSSWPEVARSALAVWVGAATHDIGFEKDPRNGKVTCEMDPAVDGERANIGQTLHGPDKLKNLTDSLPSAPVQDAKKRQRRRMPSDGRILAMLRQK